MELSNQFEVDVPIDEAWTILTDIERIAPCMPGAQLTEVEGDEYRGTVKVKVGPITAQYRGAATFEERDADAHRAVLRAEGRDTRGQGNASATITALLASAGDDGKATSVSIQTELTVTGKVAQFGRGVMADVSAKLLGQFVSCLHEKVLSGESTEAGAPAAAASDPGGSADAAAPAATGEPEHDGAAASSAAAPDAGVRRIEAPEAQPVDLLDTAGGAVAKRLLPVLAAVGLLVLVVWLLRARRR
jgi:carbon monoxide dehydrogenase subunit G